MRKQYPFFTPYVLISALLFLALAYWGRWISHPAAALNILGVDLPEYVKFVPEVRYGVIPVNRMVFFALPVSLSINLILFASIKIRIPIWLRTIAAILAIPVALSMLPPAWTPGVLKTPEFLTQTLIIMALMGAVFFTPLWHQIIPDRIRGVFLILTTLFPLPAVNAFYKLIPALEKLYHHDLHPGPGLYFLAMAEGLLVVVGVMLITTASRTSSLISPALHHE
ncbi:MAG: hypothetical protein DSY55_02785 [Clostridia bacterium]|nr:MAG: hypothetical protein DSY55_02785 [Clostridia bacterium]